MAEIDLSKLPRNSMKSKQEQTEEKEIHQLPNVTVKRKERSVMRKLADTFIADSVEDVKSHVIFDVLVPRITDTLIEMVNQGMNMLFKGNPRSITSSSKSSGGARPTVSYHSMYDSPKTHSGRRTSYALDDIIVGSRGEAEKIIDELFDILERYKVVTVADLYVTIGLSTNPQDFNYGWTNLDSATTKRTVDGYLLDLPRARPVKD